MLLCWLHTFTLRSTMYRCVSPGFLVQWERSASDIFALRIPKPCVSPGVFTFSQPALDMCFHTLWIQILHLFLLIWRRECVCAVELVTLMNYWVIPLFSPLLSSIFVVQMNVWTYFQAWPHKLVSGSLELFGDDCVNPLLLLMCHHYVSAGEGGEASNKVTEMSLVSFLKQERRIPPVWI